MISYISLFVRALSRLIVLNKVCSRMRRCILSGTFSFPLKSLLKKLSYIFTAAVAATLAGSFLRFLFSAALIA
jgi:hypothetical protein